MSKRTYKKTTSRARTSSGRGILRGGRGGKDRRSRSARVVDPGLFYALRATVKVVLWLAKGSPGKSEPLHELNKLEVWCEEARNWAQGPGNRTVDAGADGGEAPPVAKREAGVHHSGHRLPRRGKGRSGPDVDIWAAEETPLEAPPAGGMDDEA